MSVKRRQYVLKNCSLAKLERVGRAYCKQCGEPLKSGDEVFTKPSTIRQQCAYHKKCAEQVNLI